MDSMRWDFASALHPAHYVHADQRRLTTRPKGQLGMPPPKFSFGNLSISRCAAMQMDGSGLRSMCYTTAPSACQTAQLHLTPLTAALFDIFTYLLRGVLTLFTDFFGVLGWR